MATRALPDLIARIRVDSSGVDQSMTSMIASFGRANMALAGVAAGIGLLVIGGKSMIEIAEKHDKAERNLAQAIESRNASTAPVAANMDKVIKATEHLQAVTRLLAEFDLGHKGHKMTTLDLMHRQDAVAKVTAATEALKQAEQEANKVTQETVINSVTMQKEIDDFIKTNRRFISDQSEVIDGYAKLTRAGLTQDEIQKDMNRALDLAAIKHISVAEAVDLLIKAEQGRMKGLIDLGISTGKYTDAQGNLVNGAKDVAKAMAELDERTKKGRNTLTDLQKHSLELSNDWQDLSKKGGPVLLTLIDSVTKAVIGIYDAFDRIGHDDALWGAISDRLGHMADWINQWIVRPMASLSQPVDWSKPAPNVPAVGRQNNRASGGPVLPNSIYTVGERGPETLVMGPRGGMVIPNAGGAMQSAPINVTVNAQTNADAHDIAVDAAWELRKMRRNF